MEIAAIMPCRGRPEQTVRNLQRLLETAGAPMQLICIVDDDLAVLDALALADLPIWCTATTSRAGYWGCLAQACAAWPEFTHIVNLANDLIPGRHWLARGIAAYRARFGEGDGLIGFNDGLHGPEHSSHFLVSTGLLARYGGWPVWYQHNFGDTELCRRAQRDDRYGKAPWAVLFHDHLENGAADDPVYAEGRTHYAADAALFEQRRSAGWPTLH